MIYRILADAVVVLHLLFILYVVLGALFVLKWPKTAFIHLPIVVWGTLIELIGWICPLTPLENSLRLEAGLQGYETGFIEHYLLPLIYPASYTHALQLGLGAFVIAVNLSLYTLVILRYRKRRQAKKQQEENSS